MKTLRIIAMLLLLFNGTSAIFGGWSLIRDPSGSDLKMSLSYLQSSPFNDFFIPGLILFIVNGVFSLLVMLWTALRWRHYVWLILIQGTLLTGWIIVQVIMLRQFNYLHLIYGGIGLALLAIGYQLRKHVTKV